MSSVDGRKSARSLLLRVAPRLFLRLCSATRTELGRAGEELAARSLARDGWRILGRRVGGIGAEVDLWAVRADEVAVVEVKTARLRRRRTGIREEAWDLRWRPGHSLGRRQLGRSWTAARRLAARSGRRPRVLLVEVLVDRASGAAQVLAARELPPAPRAPVDSRAP